MAQRVCDLSAAGARARRVTRLGTLIAATGDPVERSRLSRLRADAKLRYRLLVEHHH